MKIGVLALQGAFSEHIRMLGRLGVQGVEVRLPHQLEGLEGLIIPGGESTTIGKLAVENRLMAPLRRFARQRAVWGTCAGMIFMARDIGRDQPLLGIMDIVVERNAFGRQAQSFEIMLYMQHLPSGDNEPFPAIFIRAPKLVAVNGDARIIAALPDGTAVAAREGRWLATAFHPELSGDPRFHSYFLSMARERRQSVAPQ